MEYDVRLLSPYMPHPILDKLDQPEILKTFSLSSLKLIFKEALYWKHKHLHLIESEIEQKCQNKNFETFKFYYNKTKLEYFLDNKEYVEGSQFCQKENVKSLLPYHLVFELYYQMIINSNTDLDISHLKELFIHFQYALSTQKKYLYLFNKYLVVVNLFIQSEKFQLSEILDSYFGSVLESFFGQIIHLIKDCQDEKSIEMVLKYSDNNTKYYLLALHKPLFSHNPVFMNIFKKSEHYINKQFCRVSNLKVALEQIQNDSKMKVKQISSYIIESIYKKENLDKELTKNLFSLRRDIKKKFISVTKNFKDKKIITLELVKILDSIFNENNLNTPLTSKINNPSLVLVPYLLTSNLFFMKSSANKSTLFSINSLPLLQKCYSNFSYQYLNLNTCSNNISPLTHGTSDVLNLISEPSSLISEYNDVKSCLSLIKFNPFVQVIPRKDGSVFIRMTSTLTNKKTIEYDVRSNLIAGEQNDLNPDFDGKRSTISDKSIKLKRSRKNSVTGMSNNIEEESHKMDNKSSLEFSVKDNKRYYNLESNFQFKELTRLLKFMFKQNVLIRKCQIDCSNDVVEIGSNLFMIERIPTSKFIDCIDINWTSSQTEFKHRALFIKAKLLSNNDVIREMNSSYPHNLIYKDILKQLNNKNEIIKFSKTFCQNFILNGLIKFIFGVDSMFKDEMISINKSQICPQIITRFTNHSKFNLRYSPSIRFFITPTQLINEAYPLIETLRLAFEQPGNSFSIINIYRK